jgi:hypothetical protein
VPSWHKPVVPCVPKGASRGKKREMEMKMPYRNETQGQNSTLQRQEFRLRILKTLCAELNFDITRSLMPDQKIWDIFPAESRQDIVKEMMYLKDKGYLLFKLVPLMAEIFPIMIKLETKAIDLIEKLDTGMPTTIYEQDFAKESLVSFSNISNSNIIFKSPNSQIINGTSDEGKGLLKYFEDLATQNKDNAAALKIISNATEKIKNNTATTDKLNTLVELLKSFGISLGSNLLTPTVQSALGLLS